MLHHRSVAAYMLEHSVLLQIANVAPCISSLVTFSSKVFFFFTPHIPLPFYSHQTTWTVAYILNCRNCGYRRAVNLKGIYKLHTHTNAMSKGILLNQL